MALFHVNAMVIHKTYTTPGADGLSQYLRSGVGDVRRYLERADPGREDLVAYGEAGLPSWAKNGTHFFAMANQYEARKDSVVGRHYQVTLPRELSPEARQALAEDIRQAFFRDYPHVWAIHNPQAKDGSGEHPHLHVLMSPRRDDGIPRTPKRWFVGRGRDAEHPEERRVPIDPTWEQKRTLQGLRHEVAVLTNAALEREGIAAAVSPERRRALGFERSGIHYEKRTTTPDERERIQVRQEARHRNGTHAFETEVLRMAWEEQKQQEGIHDLGRGAVLEQVHERFWRRDQTPARGPEREGQSMTPDQALERILERIGARVAARAPGQGPGKQVEQGYARDGNREADGMQGGIHVVLAKENG